MGKLINTSNMSNGKKIAIAVGVAGAAVAVGIGLILAVRAVEADLANATNPTTVASHLAAGTLPLPQGLPRLP